jgi:hypothetical protein
MVRLYGGARTMVGDDRSYQVRVLSDTARGDVFAKDGLGVSLGLTSETRITNPLSYGIDVDVAFGGMLAIGVGAGLGYNHCISDDVAYLQIKANASYAMTYTDIGVVPNLRVYRGSSLVLENPSLELTQSFITVRPEVNFFYRIAGANTVPGLDGILGMIGVGFNYPVATLGNVDFNFNGPNYYTREYDNVSFPITHSALDLWLDGERVTTTKVSPMGIVVNVSVGFEF